MLVPRSEVIDQLKSITKTMDIPEKRQTDFE